MVKNLPANAGDLGLIPGLGRSPGERNGNPLQYCLDNPMDTGAWQAIVQAVAKSQANLCFVCFSLSISLSVFFNLSPPLWFVFIGRNIQTLLFHIGHSRSFFLSKQDL